MRNTGIVSNEIKLKQEAIEKLQSEVDELNIELEKLKSSTFHSTKEKLSRMNQMIQEFNRKNSLNPLVLNKAPRVLSTNVGWSSEVHYRHGVKSDIIRIYSDENITDNNNFAISYFFEKDEVVLSSIKDKKYYSVKMTSEEWYKEFKSKRLKIKSVKDMIKTFLPKKIRNVEKAVHKEDPYRFKIIKDGNSEKFNFKTKRKATDFLNGLGVFISDRNVILKKCLEDKKRIEIKISTVTTNKVSF